MAKKILLCDRYCDCDMIHFEWEFNFQLFTIFFSFFLIICKVDVAMKQFSVLLENSMRDASPFKELALHFPVQLQNECFLSTLTLGSAEQCWLRLYSTFRLAERSGIYLCCHFDASVLYLI